MLYPIAMSDFSTFKIIIRYQLIFIGAMVFVKLAMVYIHSALRNLQIGISLSYFIISVMILIPDLQSQWYSSGKNMVTIIGILTFTYRIVAPSAVWSWRLFILTTLILSIVFQVKAVVLGVLLYFVMRRRLQLISLPTLRLLMVMAIGAFIIYYYIGMEIVEQDPSNAARFYFVVAARMATNNIRDLLLGPGYAAWHREIQQAVGIVPGISEEFAENPSPHNLFIELYLTGGLLLFVGANFYLYKLYKSVDCSPAFASAVATVSFTTITGIDRAAVTILLGCTLVRILSRKRGICKGRDAKLHS